MSSIKEHLLKIKTLCFKVSPALSFCYFMHLVLEDNSYFSNRFHELEYYLIKKILNRKFSDEIKRFNLSNNSEQIGKIEKIWVIWWQGIDENTPKQVIMNVEQLKKLYNDAEIIIVSKSNYKQYIETNEAVNRNFENNKMNISQFSDYIRVLLLQKYGGLYLDANFYLSQKIVYSENSKLFSINHGLYSDYHVCKGKWTTGCLLCAPNNILLNYLKCMFEVYAEEYDFYMGYFLFDAFIALAYENINSIREMVDAIPLNNSFYNFINENGNEIVEETIWNKIISENYMFNISFRKSFLIEKNGKKTYYGKLISTSKR